MRALIDLIINGKHWFLFLLFEAVSLLALFSYNGYQKSVFFTTANDVVGTAYSVISSVTSYIHLQENNQRLEETNQRLREEIAALRQKQAQEHHTDVRHEALPDIYSVVGAKVVNNSIHKSNNLMTINKGRKDGIRPEMGVISSHGVVGVVYMASDHYSIVMPLLNVNTKVSCRLRHSQYFGTLEWQRGSSMFTYATGFPRHAKVKKGDVIETNGFSDIFPPGLPIGVVAKIGDSSDGMSYRLTVQMFTDFASLRDVSVITNYSKPERKVLEQKADSVTTMQE